MFAEYGRNRLELLVHASEKGLEYKGLIQVESKKGKERKDSVKTEKKTEEEKSQKTDDKDTPADAS